MENKDKLKAILFFSFYFVLFTILLNKLENEPIYNKEVETKSNYYVEKYTSNIYDKKINSNVKRIIYNSKKIDENKYEITTKKLYSLFNEDEIKEDSINYIELKINNFKIYEIDLDLTNYFNYINKDNKEYKFIFKENINE